MSRSVLVADGDRGVGAVISKRFADMDDWVAVTRSDTMWPNLYLSVLCDASDTEEAGKAFAEVENAHGALEILVITAPGPELTDAGLPGDALFSSPQIECALASMRQTGEGRIVVIAAETHWTDQVPHQPPDMWTRHEVGHGTPVLTRDVDGLDITVHVLPSGGSDEELAETVVLLASPARLPAGCGVRPIGHRRRAVPYGTHRPDPHNPKKAPTTGCTKEGESMPTLSSMPTDKPGLGIRFLSPENAAITYEKRKVTGLSFITLSQLCEGEPVRMHGGSLVLIAGHMPLLTSDKTATTAMERLLDDMAQVHASALVITAPADSTYRIFPESLRQRAKLRSIPLMMTTARPEHWAGVHDGIRGCREEFAEDEAKKLNLLISELPEQLEDPAAMQGITDWLAGSLGAQVQVLVRDPERVLAATPPDAAEHLLQTIWPQTLQGSAASPATGHTQMFSLDPTALVQTTLAIAAPEPFDEYDARLMQHAVKFLRMADRAQRASRNAAVTTAMARSVAYQMLMAGRPHEARQVMADLAPGLLDPDHLRVFAIDDPSGLTAGTVRSVETVASGRALVITDPYETRRIVVVQPVPAGQEHDTTMADALVRTVRSITPRATVGGSPLYAIVRAADAYASAADAAAYAAQRPGSAVLSLQETALLSLLPAGPARRWAHARLSPVLTLEDPERREQLLETLAAALHNPAGIAAERLGLHRNTLRTRLRDAESLLELDLGILANKCAVSLAVELVNQLEAGNFIEPDDEPTLQLLLAAPEMNSWAQSLLLEASQDRRNLLTTARAWLAADARIKPAAMALGLSGVTVRAHITELGERMGRDLDTLSGIRDLLYALEITAQNGDRADTIVAA